MKSKTSAMILSIAVTLWGCGAPPPAATPGKAAGGGGPTSEAAAPPTRVAIELYVMSGCKFAAKMVGAMYEAQQKMGQFLSYQQYQIFTIASNGKLHCLHGDRACQADLIQMCTKSLHPDELLAVASCMYADHESMPDGWEQCAEQAGLDPGPIAECAAAEMGMELAEHDSETTIADKVAASPTMFIDGEPYRGGRTGKALVTAICLALPESERPDDCPEIAPAHLTIISDERCLKCGELAESLAGQFDSMFWQLELQWMDWSDAQAQSMMSQLGITLLPAYVFHADAAAQDGFEMIEKHVIEKDGYYIIMPDTVRSVFDPTKEICDNGIDDTSDGVVDCDDPWCAGQEACAEVCDNGVDDTANGLADCDDPDCAQTLVCRPQIAGKLDLFIMSHCPFGTKAVNQIPDVLEKMGDDIDFELHFITSVLDDEGYEGYPRKSWCDKHDDGQWYCSMHGEAETEDNARHLCAAKVAPASYLSYIVCRNADLDDEDWESCAALAGINLKKMRKCVITGEGYKLLEHDAQLSEETKIKASPTYLINNKFLEKISASPEKIIEKLCDHNPQLPKCQISDQPAPTPPPWAGKAVS